jgi:hypothetical protein
MKIEAPIAAACEFFQSARRKLDEIVSHLTAPGAKTLSETEEFVRAEGHELLRLLVQGRLDVISEREQVELSRTRPPTGVRRKARSRQIEIQFGRVALRRYGLKRRGEPSKFPLDAELNLPTELYSHPLRKRVAEEAVDGSFDRTVEQIERTTAGHVPKRQAQELVVRAAQDVDAFYKARPLPANDTLSDEHLMLLSSDAAAIRMIPEGLRDATRQAAEEASLEPDNVRGDPTATAPAKPHQTRRAVVTAVWEQERHERTPGDIVSNLQRSATDPAIRKKARGPRPQNKRVTASVEQDQRSRTIEMFDEADRRDPERKRETVILVDGDEHQTDTIRTEARRRGRSFTIVLDLLHAMHYLWVAAHAIIGSDKNRVHDLVTHWTIMLLTGNPSHVVAAIRSTATRAMLQGAARQAVDGAADYLLKRTPYLRYSDFIARGFPIATGVIEGACRYIVRDRMDITGARWNLQSAEAVLKLRAVRASSDWDDYWAFHERQEAQRNYAEAS